MSASSAGNVGRAVDWNFAATIGAKLVRPAPPATEYTRRQAMDQLSEFARAAEGPVRDVTRLNEGAAVTEARIVDRSEWVRAATESMRVMTGGGDDGTATASETKGGGITRRVTGAQTGAVLAFVSSGILGQYDPFASGGGELLLVYPNVIAVERQLRVSPADFRLWVCLHEVTHRVQFRANPWLAQHMSNSLAVITDDSGQELTQVVARLAEFVRNKRNGSGDQAPEPNSEGMVGLLRA
ncbi:MAG: zinc-dependent metalloprotease, partial [Mycobacterium sp.]